LQFEKNTWEWNITFRGQLEKLSEELKTLKIRFILVRYSTGATKKHAETLFECPFFSIRNYLKEEGQLTDLLVFESE
jgi:hypothetical protein